MTNLATMIQDLGTSFKAETGSLNSRLSELEKRAAREPDYANDNNPVAGQLFATLAGSPKLQGLSSNVRQRATIEVGSLGGEFAAITSGTPTVGSNTSAGTSLVAADRRPGMVTPPTRTLTVRDLLAVGQTASNVIEWSEETSFTNGAEPQVEGEVKGSSDLTFELRSAPVRTLAHTFTASKQILDDTPQLAGYIAARGVQGLKIVEEDQLLTGDGTGQNLLGIIPQATAFNLALLKAGDTNEVDYLRRAILQVRLTEHVANGILLHPAAAADMDLLKDGEGQYLIVDPVDGSSGRIWRLPVVESTAIDESDFLVGAFNTAAQIWDRQNATVEISSEHADYFERNLLMLRIEERIALSIYQRAAFVTGTFGATAP